jgi:hypothetical protein
MMSIRSTIGICLSVAALVGCGSSRSTDSGGGGTGGQGGSSGGSGGQDASSGSDGSGGQDGSSGGSGGAAGMSTGGSAGAGGAAGAGPCANLPSATAVDPASAPELVVASDPAAPGGIFDPSVEYPVGAPSGAMSYSAVVDMNAISTRIAVSADAGATWTYVASPNSSSDISVAVAPGSTRCPSGTCTGRLVHEVSSLVFDYDDPDASRKWKLFTHAYIVLTTSGELAYDLGHIALFTAPDPKGPWKSEGKAVGWNSESDFSSKDAATLISTFPQMADCAALTEPGALWRNGGILDLAVGCVKLANPLEIRIELLRSLDHGKTFVFAGHLLSPSDGLCVGGSVPQINAGDLFIAGGKSYLLATPEGALPEGGTGYRGCMLFELATGGTAVVRDKSGAPVVTRVLDAPDKRFTGACSAAEGATAMGFVVSEASLSSPPHVFHVYASGVNPP